MQTNNNDKYALMKKDTSDFGKNGENRMTIEEEENNEKTSNGAHNGLFEVVCLLWSGRHRESGNGKTIRILLDCSR